MTPVCVIFRSVVSTAVSSTSGTTDSKSTADLLAAAKGG